MKILTLLAIAVLTASIIWLAYYINKKQREALLALAASLGWAAVPDASALYGYIPKSLQNQGIRQYCDDGFSLKIGTVDAIIFTYTYVTEETTTDANGMTTTHEQNHTHTLLCFADTKAVGEMHIHKRGFMRLGHEFFYQGQKRLSLEGDFNKYFDVFVPEGEQIEGLEVLEPTVMEVILDSGKDYSIDVYQGNLWIIADNNCINKKAVPPLLAYAQLLLSKIN